jgi:bifunctional UDP-N-acetylglucosamine pyrophosphorylase/glucosamine-1-phosphate N-acetyltransferase
LLPALSDLSTDNSQHEYYLTDAIAALARDGHVGSVSTEPDETRGVNDREQLAEVEHIMRARDHHNG